MSYGQFCPISKAMEVLGERWTLLLVRELVMGATRFSEFQRALRQMSPSLLTKRLKQLEDEGLVVKRKIPGQKGYEYFATESCLELLPIIEQIGHWGMRWARHRLTEEDYDLDLLMLYLERSIQPDKLIGSETVIRFNFRDVEEYPSWWIVVEGESKDVCVHDPGKEVDVYFNTNLKTMCQLWMGEVSYKRAIADGKLQLLGIPALTKNVEAWMSPSLFAGVPPAGAIVDPL